jgi:hypothetical protein
VLVQIPSKYNAKMQAVWDACTDLYTRGEGGLAFSTPTRSTSTDPALKMIHIKQNTILGGEKGGKRKIRAEIEFTRRRREEETRSEPDSRSPAPE